MKSSFIPNVFFGKNNKTHFKNQKAVFHFFHSETKNTFSLSLMSITSPTRPLSIWARVLIRDIVELHTYLHSRSTASKFDDNFVPMIMPDDRDISDITMMLIMGTIPCVNATFNNGQPQESTTTSTSTSAVAVTPATTPITTRQGIVQRLGTLALAIQNAFYPQAAGAKSHTMQYTEIEIHHELQCLQDMCVLFNDPQLGPVLQAQLANKLLLHMCVLMDKVTNSSTDQRENWLGSNPMFIDLRMLYGDCLNDPAHGIAAMTKMIWAGVECMKYIIPGYCQYTQHKHLPTQPIPPVPEVVNYPRLISLFGSSVLKPLTAIVTGNNTLTYEHASPAEIMRALIEFTSTPPGVHILATTADMCANPIEAVFDCLLPLNLRNTSQAQIMYTAWMSGQTLSVLDRISPIQVLAPSTTTTTTKTNILQTYLAQSSERLMATQITQSSYVMSMVFDAINDGTYFDNIQAIPSSQSSIQPLVSRLQRIQTEYLPPLDTVEYMATVWSINRFAQGMAYAMRLRTALPTLLLIYATLPQRLSNNLYDVLQTELGNRRTMGVCVDGGVAEYVACIADALLQPSSTTTTLPIVLLQKYLMCPNHIKNAVANAVWTRIMLNFKQWVAKLPYKPTTLQREAIGQCCQSIVQMYSTWTVETKEYISLPQSKWITVSSLPKESQYFGRLYPLLLNVIDLPPSPQLAESRTFNTTYSTNPRPLKNAKDVDLTSPMKKRPLISAQSSSTTQLPSPQQQQQQQPNEIPTQSSPLRTPLLWIPSAEDGFTQGSTEPKSALNGLPRAPSSSWSPPHSPGLALDGGF
jgi:hypothetical protein